MNKYLFTALIAAFFSISISDAQTIWLPGYGPRYHRPMQRRRTQAKTQPKFEPTIDLSIGYGFPNLDKYEFPDLTFQNQNLYKGTATQNGPITGSLDYRFSRSMSIGLLVTHGKVGMPYYDYNNNYVLSGSLENWAFMLNIVRYFPVGTSKVSPYLRTAIGINTWTQNYTDASGSKQNIPGTQPSDLAYQIGLGAKINLSKNAGFFAEAGYGKYILHGGLFFKF